MKTPIFNVQYAIRPGSEERNGQVHVQVTASASEFNEAIRRHYGSAFELCNASLFRAVSSRVPTLKSKAGTSRMYVPGTLIRNGLGFDVTVGGAEDQSGVSKIFRTKSDEPVTIHITESQIVL